MKSHELKVHLTRFNGPLELLLKLIRRDKMNIYDIQISKITAQYLKYFHELKHLDVNTVGDFLVMATQLMAIKSRMLLPAPKRSKDEPDPRANLVHQLIVYKKYKKAAERLQKLELNRERSYTRPALVPSKSNHLINLHNQLSSKILERVFQRVIQRRIKQRPISENVTEWHYSVREQSRKVIQLVKLDHSVKLSVLFKLNDDLEELITNFLAILDLIKENRVKINRNHDLILVNKKADHNY